MSTQIINALAGSSMTGESLTKIGQFIPRLEKVYLDDIFTDSNYLIDRYSNLEGFKMCFIETDYSSK